MKHKVDAVDRHRDLIAERLRDAGLARPGPGSISWTVNREMIVIAGWGRAILLQLAHPLVGAGVHDHSSFRASAATRVARLRSTIGAMLAITFGDDDQAIGAAAGINAIHDRVSGRIDAPAGTLPAGAAYSAHDAELLRWVHATLLDSIMLAYEQLVGPLTADERDRYCAESAVMEPLLDIPAGLLPRNRRELDAYLRDMLDSGRIAVTDRSRTLARAVLYPPGWRLLWPAIRPVQLITIGLLPPAVRLAYGFDWRARDARALVRWTAALRWVRRLTPPLLREWPPSRRRPAGGTHFASRGTRFASRGDSLRQPGDSLR